MKNLHNCMCDQLVRSLHWFESCLKPSTCSDCTKYVVWLRLCCSNRFVKLVAKLRQNRFKLATKTFATIGPSNSCQSRVKRIHAFSAKFYTRIHAYSCKDTHIHASSCNYIGIYKYIIHVIKHAYVHFHVIVHA
jgi:hypothetical protein